MLDPFGTLNDSAAGGGDGSDGFGEEERESVERNSAGNNHWTEEETLSLLKIKSEACSWDEVSRKLAELGYHQSAKKCKEKFENIYKYHKRTKEPVRRSSKNYGSTEQLELFDNMTSIHSPSPIETQPLPMEATRKIHISETKTAIDTPIMSKPLEAAQEISTPCSVPKSSSTSVSTTSSSGRESKGNGNGKKKRKLEDYFNRLMKQVFERQEKMQKMFVEALEKSENDRKAREEAWKAQELARLKREQEMLAQERAALAARDAAMVALLQKISEQGNHIQLPEILLTPSSNTSIPAPTPISDPSQAKRLVVKLKTNNAENSHQWSSSRWPKTEIETLIRLRTELDVKYQDVGARGSLWEGISQTMKKIGYNRNAKRCKEKWENINKYYRRMKERNKRRPEDSKTCPYYDLLELIYEKKQKEFGDSGDKLKPEDILMQMQQQQWDRIESVEREDVESENDGQNQEDDAEDEYAENGNDYHGVDNSASSLTIMQ